MLRTYEIISGRLLARKTDKAMCLLLVPQACISTLSTCNGSTLSEIFNKYREIYGPFQFCNIGVSSDNTTYECMPLAILEPNDFEVSS